jgi:glycosyltransferase involved in cell wall biosynthesis
VIVAPPQSPCSQARESSLGANAFAYDALRDRLEQVGWEADPRGALECIEHAADFAAANHPGRFADGGIENLALAIGGRLDDLLRGRAGGLPGARLPRAGRDGRRNVLHVMTGATVIGGLTQTVVNWVRGDPESRHSVLLTRQEYSAGVRPWLVQAVRDNGGDFIVLPREGDLLLRAWWVRQCVQSSADLVVLHQNWSDVVPVVALAVGDCPPVAIVNQVDHLFWLGGTVTDAVINLRQASQDVTGNRRFTRRDLLLPIPLTEPAAPRTRDEDRRALGIPAGQTVLLTVGREVKYLRGTSSDFFTTALRILEENPAAHLYVVGVSEEFAARSLRDPRHDRLHFLGVLEDPSLYRAAADVYLESFPFGSQTAMLEAGLAGLAPVRAVAPPYPLLVTQDECLAGLVDAPADEGAYIRQANHLIRNVPERQCLGAALRARVVEAHTGGGWRKRLAAVYADMAEARHEPRPIPRAECSADPVDLALSAWQDALRVGTLGPLAEVPDDLEPPFRPLIALLRGHSHRSSRLASRRLFQFYIEWIDETAARGGGGRRDARRRELLLSLADRLTWAKWERDWDTYHELRELIRSHWNGPGPLPLVARQFVAPRFLYRAKDAFDRLVRYGRGVWQAVPPVGLETISV